jgi:hypothetical protein
MNLDNNTDDLQNPPINSKLRIQDQPSVMAYTADYLSHVIWILRGGHHGYYAMAKGKACPNAGKANGT